MNIKQRVKLLKIIAQEVVPQKHSVSGSPQAFNLVNVYPNIIVGLNQVNANRLSILFNIINQALYYTSDGQIDLSWMRSRNFNFGTTSVIDRDLKNLMEFCKLVYNLLITNRGSTYKAALSAEDLENRVLNLMQSQYLNNLSSTKPNSQLSTKIPGNLKTIILDNLRLIK